MEIGKTYTGKEFNALNKDILIKITNWQMVHKKFRYRIGLNTDFEKFVPEGKCRGGGLYFASINDIRHWVTYGNGYHVVTIPDDTLVYIEKNKMKAKDIIISKKVDFIAEPHHNRAVYTEQIFIQLKYGIDMSEWKPSRSSGFGKEMKKYVADHQDDQELFDKILDDKRSVESYWSYFSEKLRMQDDNIKKALKNRPRLLFARKKTGGYIIPEEYRNQRECVERLIDITNIDVYPLIEEKNRKDYVLYFLKQIEKAFEPKPCSLSPEAISKFYGERIHLITDDNPHLKVEFKEFGADTIKKMIELYNENI